jgi:hypothetical protein
LGIIAGGGRKVIRAVIAAGLGGGPNGRIPGGNANAHGGGTMGGMPGLGGAIFGFIKRGAPIGNGVFGILPELNRAVV